MWWRWHVKRWAAESWRARSFVLCCGDTATDVRGQLSMEMQMSLGQKSTVLRISDTVAPLNKFPLRRTLWVIGTSAPAIKAPKANSITSSMSFGFPADIFWHLSQMMFDFWALETFNGVHSAINLAGEPGELWLCRIDLPQCVYWLRSPESLLQPVKGSIMSIQ